MPDLSNTPKEAIKVLETIIELEREHMMPSMDPEAFRKHVYTLMDRGLAQIVEYPEGFRLQLTDVGKAFVVGAAGNA